jgi:hypothetical protein
MSRKWMAAAALAVAGAITPTVPALAASVSAHIVAAAAPGQSGLPAALRVPAGNHLLVSLHVIQGVQVYTCTNRSLVVHRARRRHGRHQSTHRGLHGRPGMDVLGRRQRRVGHAPG